MYSIYDKQDLILERKAQALRKAPKKFYEKRKKASVIIQSRQAEIKASYDKSMKLRADYAKFQARRIHNVVKGVVPEGGRHG